MAHLTDSFPRIAPNLVAEIPFWEGSAHNFKNFCSPVEGWFPKKKCPTLKSSASSWYSLWTLPKNRVSTDDVFQHLKEMSRYIFPQDIPVSLLFKHAIFVGLSTNKQSTSTQKKLDRPSDKAKELEVFKPKRASVAFNHDLQKTARKKDLRRFYEVFLKVGKPLGSND